MGKIKQESQRSSETPNADVFYLSLKCSSWPLSWECFQAEGNHSWKEHFILTSPTKLSILWQGWWCQKLQSITFLKGCFPSLVFSVLTRPNSVTFCLNGKKNLSHKVFKYWRLCDLLHSPINIATRDSNKKKCTGKKIYMQSICCQSNLWSLTTVELKTPALMKGFFTKSSDMFKTRIYLKIKGKGCLLEKILGQLIL